MIGALSVPMVLSAESLQDAFRWTYQENPDLKAARAGVRQALAGAHITNSAARPQVNFSSNYGYSAARSYQGPWQKGDSLSATVSASLLLYDGGQSGLATDAALANTRASEYRLNALEQQMLLATARAYLDVLQFRAMVSSAQKNINALAARKQSAQVSYDTGAATITELSQTEAAVSQANADLASARANLARAEADYRALTGRSPGDLARISNLPPLPGSMGAAQQVAVQSSPLVMAALEGERAAQYDLRRAEAGHMPQVTLSGSATRTNDLSTGYNDNAQIGLGVQIPLYTGGRIEALQSQARAALEARAAETTSTRLQAEANVANAWAQLQNAKSANQAMQQVVEAQSLADQGAEVEYEVGALTVADRLTAQQNLINARSNLLSTQYQRQFAVFNVLFAMGQLSVEGMGLNIPRIDPINEGAEVNAPPSAEAQAVDQISDRWDTP